MEFITHKHVADWGITIHFMEKNGKAYAKCYYYVDKPKSFCLSDLNVDEDSRRKGYGLKLQLIREELALELGYKYTYLFVEKKSWMKKWYERRGYKYYSKYREDKKMVWMRKKIIV